MAHLAGKQLMALLRLFPSGHIDKNAEHDPADNAGVVALTARGYPSHVVPKHDAKVDFVRFKNRPRGSKSRPHAVPVGRMEYVRRDLRILRWRFLVLPTDRMRGHP